MTSRRVQLLVLAAVVAAGPLLYAGWSELQLHRGRHVLLRVMPVDPIDPLHGEYVALGYPFSSVALRGAHDGDTVYVPLERTAAGVWSGRAATATRPGHGVFLRGRVAHAWSGGATVRYGIEAFYVRQGTARRYEQAVLQHSLYADVVVAEGGHARLATVLVR